MFKIFFISSIVINLVLEQDFQSKNMKIYYTKWNAK